MEEFYRIRRLPPYVFEEVNRAKARARAAKADIIDLGMAEGQPVAHLAETVGAGKSGLPMPRSMISAPPLRARALARFTSSNT